MFDNKANIKNELEFKIDREFYKINTKYESEINWELSKIKNTMNEMKIEISKDYKEF